jgi:hypothetical protein
MTACSTAPPIPLDFALAVSFETAQRHVELAEEVQSLKRLLAAKGAKQGTSGPTSFMPRLGPTAQPVPPPHLSAMLQGGVKLSRYVTRPGYKKPGDKNICFPCLHKAIWEGAMQPTEDPPQAALQDKDPHDPRRYTGCPLSAEERKAYATLAIPQRK